MNLLFAIDKNVAHCLITCLKSIEVNGGAEHYDAYVLSSDLKQEDIDEIKNQLPLSVTGHFITIPEDMFDDFATTKVYPKQIYYRLAAAEFLPKDLDRVLYLDVDLVVINSLVPLYESDFGDAWFIGSTHIGWFLTWITCVRLGIKYKKDLVYLNTGVMLMDLEKMRQGFDMNAVNEFGLKKKKAMMFPDQDILIGLYGDKIKKVDDMIYNLGEQTLIDHNKKIGNKKKDATKWCVATVLSFWTGTALIKSLHIYETSKVATSLNAITCVGLVVSVVLISLALIFRFAAKAKESFSGRDLVKYFSGFVFLVLSLVIFGLLKHGALTVTTFKDGEPYLREMQHPLQLASDIIADIGKGTTRYNGSVDPNLTLSYFSDIKLYAIFLTIFQALSFCLVAFVLFRVLGGKKVGEIVWGLLLIGTVGVLVFALLLRGACIDVNLYVDKTQITMTYGWCIVLVALSFVGLVASILTKLLFKKAKE